MTELRMVAWEVTRNCNLSCRHCRAAASSGPYKGELSTEECYRVMDSIGSFSRATVILTGGEPLLRADVVDLVRRGTGQGLVVVMAPNGTLLDRAKASELKDAGLKRVSISIDGASAASHDELRQVEGAFEGALAGVSAAREAGLEFQLNTTVTGKNAHELDEILDLGRELGAVAHHMFFLVPTGRGKEMAGDELDAREYEKTLVKLSRQDDRQRIRVTCAPHYYRILSRQEEEAQVGNRQTRHPGGHARRGCLAGGAFCFISHVGDVQPCGYLELKCGNVREARLEEIWKGSDVFRQLRDPALLKGKCGHCEYKVVCGGCRARAYETAGNHLEEEPCCLYVPRELRVCGEERWPGEADG